MTTTKPQIKLTVTYAEGRRNFFFKFNDQGTILKYYNCLNFRRKQIQKSAVQNHTEVISIRTEIIAQVFQLLNQCSSYHLMLPSPQTSLPLPASQQAPGLC